MSYNIEWPDDCLGSRPARAARTINLHDFVFLHDKLDERKCGPPAGFKRAERSLVSSLLIFRFVFIPLLWGFPAAPGQVDLPAGRALRAPPAAPGAVGTHNIGEIKVIFEISNKLPHDLWP